MLALNFISKLSDKTVQLRIMKDLASIAGIFSNKVIGVVTVTGFSVKIFLVFLQNDL